MSLKIETLHKSFGTHHVVRGLELELDTAEVVALLGPSGCGKTTALRMVAGLETPDSGRIVVGDREVYGPQGTLPPEKRKIGMVFQTYAVWPHKNVRENVAYPLRLAKSSDAGQRADDALSRVKLPDLGDRAPGTLSGGQQQRVALARALVSDPALLLFDEPLSNLDAKLRDEMRHEIRELAKSTGVAALYVTHDQAEAFAVSDRVAVVLEGQVAQCAAPATLYEEPASIGVARFVGRMSELKAVRSGSAARVGDLDIPCSYAAGTEGQEDLLLGVRPEAVHLAESGLAGRVQRSTFLGDRSEVEVETEAGMVRVDVRGPAPAADEAVHVQIDAGRVYPWVG